MSKLSRRKFIGSVAVAAGAMLTLGGSAVGQAAVNGSAAMPAGAADALSRLGWESFLPYVNTDFAFYKKRMGGSSVLLRLVDMKDSRRSRSRGRRNGQENFVLKFESSEPLTRGDSIYSVEHFGLGNFEIFVTDGGKNDADNNIYIAVINRVTVPERM